MASPASAGASAPPSGENTVARTGFTTPPVAPESPGALQVAGLRPSWSPSIPPPTSPKILLEHRRQHDQRDDDDRACHAQPDHQPRGGGGRAPPRRLPGRRPPRRARGLPGRGVDRLDLLGAIGHGGGLLEQVEQRGCSADTAAVLDRAGRGGRDLERDAAVHGPWFDGLPGRIERGGLHAAGRARLAQWPAVDQQGVQRRPDAADVVLGRGIGHGGGERQRDVSVDADPDAAGVVNRQRDAGLMCGLGSCGQ